MKDRLTRIKIEGFRSIKSLELEMGPVSVLIGANGAGKSNLVGFFKMLSSVLSGSLQLYIGRQGGGQSILHYGSKQTPVLHAELQFEGVFQYRFSLAHAAGDRLIYTDEQIELPINDEPKTFVSSLGAGHRESELLPLSNALGPDGKPLRVPTLFIERLKAVRAYHFHDTSEVSKMRNSQELNRNDMLLNDGGNLAAFLYSIQEGHRDHFRLILETFQTIVPYVRQLLLRPDVLDPKSILLRWKDTNVDYEFGAHQLSDGSLRALALVTALLQPEETLPGIILIDEPELGLHPAGIAVIASLIRSVSSKRQVIVCTQSPRFLAEFEAAQVIVVERQEDSAGFGQSVFTHLDGDALKGWLEDYDLGTLYEMQVTGGAPQ